MRFLRVAFLGAILVLAVPGKSFAQTFSDVPANYWAYSFIETFAARGITSGCGNSEYCPEDRVTRAQMAVFLERGMQGAGFVPPPATGTLFGDVAANDFAAAFIEQLFADGITGGCGNGDYCPSNNVTRAQMAVFLLRAMHGSGYAPPPATGVFNDVPLGSFADAWIEQLAVEQITSGCGGGSFCPNDSVTRAQMAVFIVRALLEPSVLTGIQLSQSSIVLDRWGDTAVVDATAVDQDGIEVPGATITWMSSDANVAAVDNAGNVSTWLGGDVVLTVEASKDTVTVNDTVAVNVAIQQNSNCTVPTEFPVQGPVAPPADWTFEYVDTGFDQGSPDHSLAFDMDLDGDNDLVLGHDFGRRDSPNEGEPPGFVQRVWLNDGNGQFTDGTLSMLGGSDLLELGTWLVLYRDFTGDGHLDAFALNSGIETVEDCSSGPTACIGFPNTLLVPQPGAGVADLAPSNVIPYETDGKTFGGDAADVDCDGDEDVYLPGQDAFPVAYPPHMFINDGTGVLTAEDQRIPPYDSNGAFCDLDRDGDQDLIHTGGTISPSDSYILVNNGFGYFRYPGIALPETPPGKFSISCTDIDLNGYPDPVISNECNEFPDCDPPAGLDVQVQVMLNQGDLSFSDSTSSLLPSDTDKPFRDLGLRDLNGDGWPDMLVPDPGGPNVLWNTGGGMFNRQYLPVGSTLSGVSIADFDGDERPDIHLDRYNWQDQQQNLIWWNREGQTCGLGPGEVWAPEARDCTAEDCNSDGRWYSWDGKSWCRALITQEGQGWSVTVPNGKSTFEFWADWGAWDMNACGDGLASISIVTCGLNADLTRDGEEQQLSCDVSGETSIMIEQTNVGLCDYVIIGDPLFR